MAVVELSDTWVLENFAQVFDTSNVDEAKDSPPLDALIHYSFPGLSWRVQLYPRGDSRAKPGYASVYAAACFGSQKESVASVWAMWTVEVVAGDAKANLQKTLINRSEYLSGGPKGWGVLDAFLQEELKAAVRADGHLEMKLDLTLLKVVDVLKCRETVRALLTDYRHADIKVEVDGTTFNGHKAILARACPGFTGSVPDGTTADAFAAFLGCVYYDSFHFRSNWELARDVLRLSDEIGAKTIKEYCDDALANMVPTLGFPICLEVLPESIRRDALSTKAACIQVMAEKKDILTSADWIDFKKVSEDAPLFQAICDALLEELGAGMFRKSRFIPIFITMIGAVASSPEDWFAPEVLLNHTWAISSADLLKASLPVVPRPTFLTSPPLLKHRAFAGLEWQLEFHPLGNAEDPEWQPGFTSLYLKAVFDPKNDYVKSVYAKWKATIIVKDGTQIAIPDICIGKGQDTTSKKNTNSATSISGSSKRGSTDVRSEGSSKSRKQKRLQRKAEAKKTYNRETKEKMSVLHDSSESTLYMDAKETTFGYANAFTLEQYEESREANNQNLDIRLDLIIANVHDMLGCQIFMSSFHTDKIHADVEIDVNGTIFKAHRFILAARSTVFAQMFEADMVESKSGKVEVKETTLEAFEAFLAGVYYASWTFLSDMDDTIDVLSLAERYAVVDLKRYCDESLAQFANASTLLTILPYAVTHNAEATKAACVEILFSNPDLVKSDGWIKFKREAKTEIMADIAEAVGELYRKERKHRVGN